MITKLTLTIEDSVVKSAKKYASQKGKSLSDIVENYLKSVSTPEDSEQKLSPRVLKMMGVIKLPADFDYKKDLANALTKKYQS
jgi:murein DD-endopeptidase MepM/ murein hydrolase activator NlpD